MTIRADIITTEYHSGGWVEVDPFDYNYTGPDPDGEVEEFLSKVDNGTITFDWPVESEEHSAGTEYPADMVMLSLKQGLDELAPIWYVELPSDFTTTVTYGG